MSELPHASHFSELIVWKKSRGLARDILVLSKSFPDEERYSLTDQIRRSSRSVGAQIAEAWAKRRYRKNFISKLTDADGEQNETQHWLIIALDSNYVDTKTVSELGGRCKEIGAMLGKIISLSDQFCGEFERHESPLVREPENLDEFFTNSNLY